MGLAQTGVSLRFYNLNKINTASFPKFEDLKKKTKEKLNKLSDDDKYYYTLGYGM